MKADYHVHTYYSDDSECPMEDMIRQALVIDLDEIAFTEHVDYGVKTVLNCDYANYFKELQHLQQKYHTQLTIRTGIEFGVQPHTIPLFQADCEQYDFDFIILSNHQIDNQEFWNYTFQEGRTQEEYQTAYYQAILDVVQNYKDYSVLGHLDMIKRYDKNGDYPDQKIRPIVEKIFCQIIEDGKGIEVNTSCFKYNLKDLTPSKEILRLYRQMGGQILTIGSDTHDTAHLGDQIEAAKSTLKEIGFQQFCTFWNMQPVYHDL